MKLVTYGLIDKRAETVGKIEALQAQLAQHLADLDSLDRTIRIFEPDIDLTDAPVKPVPPPNAAFRGEVQRFLLHTIRKSDVALTTHELARLLMEARGLNTADKALFKTISVRTGHSLAKLRRSGHIVSQKASKGGLLRWQLTSRGRTEDWTGQWRNGATVNSRPV